jgi:hypothetical protein
MSQSSITEGDTVRVSTDYRLSIRLEVVYDSLRSDGYTTTNNSIGTTPRQIGLTLRLDF